VIKDKIRLAIRSRRNIDVSACMVNVHNVINYVSISVIFLCHFLLCIFCIVVICMVCLRVNVIPLLRIRVHSL
jgi:hypothetical protein